MWKKFEKNEEKKEIEGREEIEPKRKKSEIRPVMICKLLILIGTCLILFAPLVISKDIFFPFVATKSLYFMGLVQVIFFAWLALMIFSSEYRPRWNPILIALILFMAIFILAAIFGADPLRSFWSKYERMTGVLMWIHLFAFFLVISSTFRRWKDWVKIFSASIFVAVLVALLSLFPNLGGEFLAQSAQGGSTIGNTSFMGIYLLFNIFLALYLILKVKINLKIFLGISIAIIFLSIYLADARAATLSLIIGLAFLFLFYLAFVVKKNYLKIFGIISLIGVLLASLVIAFYVFQPNNVIHNWFVERATYARLVVWEGAWQGFLERPILGWGPENFEFVFVRHFNPCMSLSECGGEIWFDRAHNIVLETLVSTGILGLMAYIGIFLAVFYILWRKYFKKEVSFWMVGIFSIALIAYFIQNLTVFDTINSYLMFFLVLGFVASVIIPKEEEEKEEIISQKRISFSPWLISIFVILFSFSLFYFVIQPLKASHYIIAAFRKPFASEERLNLYEKSLETSPMGRYQVREFFGKQALQFISSEYVREVSAEGLRKDIDFIIKELEKTIKEAPLDFRPKLILGEIYNYYAILLDEQKIFEAERVLKKAIEVSPSNQQGYWALSQTRLYQGKDEESIYLAGKALELEPRLLQSHFVIIQIAQLIGDYQLAERKIQEAIKINPEWEKVLTENL